MIDAPNDMSHLKKTVKYDDCALKICHDKENLPKKSTNLEFCWIYNVDKFGISTHLKFRRIENIDKFVTLTNFEFR